MQSSTLLLSVMPVETYLLPYVLSPDGKTTLPPPALLTASIAACIAAVSSVNPSPVALYGETVTSTVL